MENALKRFVSFSYCDYDARGGWEDCDGDYETLDEAIAHVKVQFNRRPWFSHVVDLKTGEVVFRQEGGNR